MSDAPRNREEYFSLAERFQDELFDIITNFSGRDNAEEFILFLNEQSNSIASILHQAWSDAPDRPWIHSIPGWNALCDLCSEDYVLYEGQE